MKNIFAQSPAQKPYLLAFLAAICLALMFFLADTELYLMMLLTMFLAGVASIWGGYQYFSSEKVCYHSQKCQVKGALVLGLFCTFAAPLFVLLINIG